MLRLLIVDDEPIILEGLQKIIDWERFGFNVVAVASDGESAFEKARQYLPDVIITDIVMNFMDGLDLIKAVKQVKDDVSFVVMSAYQEFEYAKEACNLGVYSYLSKPIEKEELLKIMLSLKDKILQERSIREKMENITELIKEDHLLLIDQFVKRIFNNKAGQNEIDSKSRLLNINFDNKDIFAVAIIKINTLAEEIVLRTPLEVGQIV